MSDPTMISREEVEKMAAWLDLLEDDIARRKGAAMLRALLAERDAMERTDELLRSEIEALSDQRDEAIALAERHMNEKHKAQRQAAEDWDVLQQQIAAARAEAVRLREALTNERAACIADVEAEPEFPGEPTAAQIALIREHPILAMREAVRVTKACIIDRTRARIAALAATEAPAEKKGPLPRGKGPSGTREETP